MVYQIGRWILYNGYFLKIEIYFFKPTLCFLTLWFSLDKIHSNKMKNQNFRSLNELLRYSIKYCNSFYIFFYSVSKIHLCQKYVLTTYSVVSSVPHARETKLNKTNSLLCALEFPKHNSAESKPQISVFPFTKTSGNNRKYVMVTLVSELHKWYKVEILLDGE